MEQIHFSNATLFRTHLREQDHIADGGGIGEQHDQAINADAAAASGWQAVFQGTNVIGIIKHGFFITRFLGFGLFLKALSLVFRVIQFGKPIGNFAAALRGATDLSWRCPGRKGAG